jgi:hypothetical protein
LLLVVSNNRLHAPTYILSALFICYFVHSCHHPSELGYLLSTHSSITSVVSAHQLFPVTFGFTLCSWALAIMLPLSTPTLQCAHEPPKICPVWGSSPTAMEMKVTLTLFYLKFSASHGMHILYAMYFPRWNVCVGKRSLV